MELRDLLRVVKRRFGVLVLVFVVAASAMGSGLFYTRKALFKAEAMILFKPTPIETGVYVTTSFPAALAPVKSRMTLIRGVNVLREAGKILGMDADEIAALLAVTVGAEDNTVVLAVTHADQAEALRILKGVLEAYRDYDRLQVTGRLEERERTLKKAVKDADGRWVFTLTAEKLLAEADAAQREIDAARAEAESRGIIDLDLQVRLMSEQVASSMTLKRAAELDGRKADQRVKDLESRSQGSVVQQVLIHQYPPIVEAPEYVSEARPLLQRLGELKATLAKYEKQYTDDYRKVGELRDEIVALETEIRDLSRVGRPEELRVTKAERSIADANVKFLETAIRGEHAALTEVQRIQRRLKDNEQVVKDRREAARNLEADAATINEQKAMASNAFFEVLKDPKTSLARAAVETSTLVVTGFLALLLALGSIYVLEYVNDTIRTVADVRTYMNLPTLGIIPVLDEEPTSLMDTAIKSPSFEENNKVATFIEATLGELNRKILLVSSAKAGEGKTSVCANLAIALARGGRRVAVVDGDMRRGQMHKVFKLDNARGLSNLLAGEMEAEVKLAEATGGSAPSLRSVLLPTSVENLLVLPCGPVPPNPIGLLRGPRARQAFDALEKDPSLDLVLIDTPPLLGVIDAAVITAFGIPAVLVVQEGAVRRAEIAHVKTSLTRVAAKLLGVILNKARIEPETYPYYYYRYRGYSS